MQARGDRELIEGSRRGDRDAFAEIIERYQRAVYAVAFSGTRDRAFAEDVTQDAFVIAWRKLDELRDPDKLPAWLCGIARYGARDVRKRRRCETHDAVERAIDPTTPYDVMSEAESERIVAAALGQVPDAYREPLVLYYYEEQSIEDVARCLGLTAATTNKRLSRGRRYLAERVAIVERGVTRRGASATLAASVLALIGITVPASHVDASPVQKGSTMHKLAIAATVAATLTAGGVVIATTARSSDARPSTVADRTAAQLGGTGAAHAHGGAAPAAHGASAPPSLASLLGVRRHGAAAVAAPARDCSAVGAHLADLEGGTGDGPSDPTRCATDYTSLCETEGWSLQRRSCVLAADDLINAHLCAVEQLVPKASEPIPEALACTTIAPHITPIIQSAGFYADTPDFATQVESACENGAWSIALRQCFAAVQTIEELHGCIQPTN